MPLRRSPAAKRPVSTAKTSGSTAQRRTTLRIRPATLDDLPVLVHQRRQMFLAMGEGDAALLRRADRAYARWFREQARRKRIHAVLAEVKPGTVVAGGTIWLQERQPRPGFDGGPAPYLMSMFTEPDYRGQGIATAVLEAAILWCREQGYGTLSLHASPDGKRLYRRRGFLRTQEFRLRLLAEESPAKTAPIRKPRRS